MVKVVEDLKIRHSKQTILECINSIDSVITFLKSILPDINDEQDIENIYDIIIDVNDNLDDINIYRLYS